MRRRPFCASEPNGHAVIVIAEERGSSVTAGLRPQQMKEWQWLEPKKTTLPNPAGAGKRRRSPCRSPPPGLPRISRLALPSVPSPKQRRAPGLQRSPRLFPRSPVPPQDRARQRVRPPAHRDRVPRRRSAPCPAHGLKAACWTRWHGSRALRQRSPPHRRAP